MMFSILLVFSCYSIITVRTHQPSDSGSPLILTPLIENGNISAAQALARVKPLKDDVASYAGFFTVDKRYNSNMFFWFFPAANNSETAPVVLWLEGGPGASSLFSLFYLHGPYYLSKQGRLKSRKYTWTSTHSVIYIDNPVGTGFSFTDNNEGYSRNEVDVGNNLYSAVVQFFQLFPQYKNNDFFVAGESYAGKYVPAVSYMIHTNNPTAKTKINLKGLIMGNAYCDPEHMVTSYGDYYYQIGLIDLKQKKDFHSAEQKGLKLIQEKKWLDALNVFDALLDGSATGYPSLFFNFTDFKYNFNFLYANEPKLFGTYDDYVTRNEIRKAIHVGNATLNDGVKVAEALALDIMQSVKPWVEILLENYKILFYSGQLDLIVAYPYTLKFLYALNWSGAAEYKTAVRTKWYVDKELAGYSKTAKNLTEVLIRNAGHLPPIDQPRWTLDLVTRFTSNGFTD